MYSEEGGVSWRLGVDVAEEDITHPVIIAVLTSMRLTGTNQIASFFIYTPPSQSEYVLFQHLNSIRAAKETYNEVLLILR